MRRAASAGYTLTCPDGYRLLSSDTFATAGTCVACAPGTASRDGLRCTPCNVGWNASASGSRWCNQCPAGSISVTAASPTGTNVTMSGLTYIYGLNAGTVCYQCPAGYYQPVPGGHVCLPCSPGEQQQRLEAVDNVEAVDSQPCMHGACMLLSLTPPSPPDAAPTRLPPYQFPVHRNLQPGSRQHKLHPLCSRHCQR